LKREKEKTFGVQRSAFGVRRKKINLKSPWELQNMKKGFFIPQSEI